MLRTFKVLALIIYEDRKKVVTTNMVRAKDKNEAMQKVIDKYMKGPRSKEVFINKEKDVIQLI